MFRSTLKSNLKEIFRVPKITLDAFDYDAPEQDTLFIELGNVRTKATEANGGKAIAKVEGELVIFSQAGKLPFGFFGKRIASADLEYKKDIHFGVEQDVATSPARMINIHERRISFLYLFETQYDPDHGTLTSLETGD